MLAAAVHPTTGQLWVLEMGPLGPVDTPLAQCLIGHFKSMIMGHATHLGKFSGVGSTCISTLEPDADPPFLPPGPPPYFTASFSNPRWVLTAASGDDCGWRRRMRLRFSV
jgi:hypothetical protein